MASSSVQACLQLREVPVWQAQTWQWLWRASLHGIEHPYVDRLPHRLGQPQSVEARATQANCCAFARRLRFQQKTSQDPEANNHGLSAASATTVLGIHVHLCHIHQPTAIRNLHDQSVFVNLAASAATLFEQIYSCCLLDDSVDPPTALILDQESTK